MKIAVIFPKDSEALFDRNCTQTFGGASVQMYAIAKALSKRREVKTVALIPELSRMEADAFKEFPVECTFRRSDALPRKVIKFVRALWRVHPDVIVQHGLTLFSCILALLSRAMGIEFVFMLASDREAEGRYQASGRLCRLFPLLTRYASVIVTQHEAQERILRETWKRQSVIIYNGFEQKSERVGEGNGMLWVGRHDPVKRPELFVELAASVPEVPCIMVCPKIPGETEDAYRAFTEQARKIRNLTIHEYVPWQDIDAYFAQASLFVNTSRVEGFPQTFIQAAMNSVPIVSMTVNPDEMITRHACGTVCGDDLSAVRTAILMLLNDQGRLRTLGRNSGRYARTYHDIERTIDQLLRCMMYDEA